MYRGDVDALRDALDAGADPDAVDLRGVPLLAAAARSGARCVALLLERGASPNPPWDPEAARERDRRFDPEAELADGPYPHEVPLFVAARADDPTSVRALLAAGADPRALCRGRQTPLFEARSATVARALLDAGGDLDHRNEFDQDALTSAASDGDLARIEALLAVGADPNARHDRGYTVLMTALGAMDRTVKVLERLVRAGADPHAVTDLGYGGFHAALDVNGAANRERSVRATMRFLAKRKVALEGRDHLGWTPLARAVHVGTDVEVCVLCELGADVNALAPTRACGTDPCPSVPLLFHALESDSSAKLQALLRAGADVSVRDNLGRTPADAGRARLLSVLEWSPSETRDAVIADLERCLSLVGARSDDESVLASRLRAAMARRGRDFEAMLHHAAHAAASAPDDVEARHFLALALQESGRLSEAAAAYRELIAGAPDASFGCKLNLGNTLVELGRHAEALEWHDAALSEAARSPNALTGRALALKGLGRAAEAEVSLDEALQIDGAYVPALVEKSTALGARGEHERALALLERAVAVAPDDAHALSGLGSTLSNLGRYDEALTAQSKAMAAKPDFWHPFYCRGCTLALMGRHDEALEALARALQLAPGQKRLIASEQDLVSLRGDPRFRRLVE